MKYDEYITLEGDRWDLISHKFYQTPFEYERIIAANYSLIAALHKDRPGYIDPVLQSGLKLKIPHFTKEPALRRHKLPPWKRSAQ